MWKKSISMFLCICMFFASALSVSASNTNSGSKSGEKYTLAIDKKTCTVSVLNQNGETMLSTNPSAPVEDEFTSASILNNVRSQLIVSYYNAENVDSTIGSYISSIKRKTFKITESDNGKTIRVDYDFSRKNEKFKIPVEYRLSGERFQVKVLTDEIEEYGEKKIHKILVAPYMVRGTAEDDGYLLLPDGSGAKVDFSYINPNASPYSAAIYGKNIGEARYYEEGNPKQVILPVFGADYVNYSVLAKVDSNASAGYIEAECVGGDSSYAHVYAAFVYRIFNTVTIAGQDWQYKEYVAESEVVEKEDFSVSYYITDKGGLVSLAEKCREIAENLPDAPDKPLTGALYAYGATTQRAAFLGIPYTKTLEATTFEDVSDMLDSLSGKDRYLAVMLQDFDKASLKEKYPTGIKWSKYSGGAKAFKKLVSEYGEKHSFYDVQNLMYEKSESFMWAKQDKYAKTVSKETLARYTYSPVTYAGTKTDWYGLNLSNLVSKAAQALKKAESSDCGVALRYLGTELYGDYSKSGGTSRSEFSKGIAKLLEKRSGKGKLAVDGGNAYTIGNADVYYNFPVSSSSFNMATESVPFAQLVYHGSINMVSSTVNMCDNPQMELLNCVASGTVPCFAVTGMSNIELRRSGYKTLFGTYFDNQEKEISDFFSDTTEYYNKIYDQKIVSYECQDDVSVTVYENGVTAVVNYSREKAVYNGVEIEPRDFMIIFN